MKDPLHNSMSRLALTEKAFLANAFLAPVLRGRGVTVRIAGVRCDLKVQMSDFEGWGVFRPQSHSAARFERNATAVERRRYLELFRAAPLVVCTGSPAVVAMASEGTECVAVSLALDCDLFDSIIARFDGRRHWFDQPDPRADPAAATYLRRCLASMDEPAALERPCLTRAQRLAYVAARDRRLAAIEADEQQRGEMRLKDALSRANAQLQGFTEAGDAYRVTYTVDGARHTSLVRRDDLTVLSSGICLSGLDADFDLNSLVGVLREGALT